jgi:pantoate--beta-alanine ligase
VDIVDLPTVRDADGLALSSRNAFLSAKDRRRALTLPQALDEARDRIVAGEPAGAVLAQAKQALVDAGFLKIDYVALVDSTTFEPLSQAGGEMRLIAAASIGGTRLIDNIRVVSDTVSKSRSPSR